jgi:quinoprotein glucose dehydrogenase
MRCHKAEGRAHAEGGDAGPDLSGISKRHDRRYFLESMVSPGAVVTPRYGITSITFRNGASLGGTLLEETPEHLDISTPEKALRVKRSDIEGFTPPISAMPPMGDLLKAEELRDLVAWLASLAKEAKQVNPPEPEPVDPAKLPGAKPQSRRSPFDQVLIPISTAGEAAPPEADAVKIGRQQFVCGACHGQQGEGTAAGPPLAGSEWVNGPAENLIRIQLRGLIGPIKVKGQEYDFPAGMVAMAYQSDEQIAAVLTYVRSNFGNDSPAVSPGEVTALRSEAGKPQLTAAELIQPEIVPVMPSERSTKYDTIGSSSGFPVAIVGGVVAIGLLCAALLFRK